MVHEPDVLALVDLGLLEVQVEEGIGVRRRVPVLVVDDAVAVLVGPEVPVAVDVGPVVGEEPPGLIFRVVAVGVELVARIVQPHDHEVGVRMSGDPVAQVDQVVGGVEVVDALVGQVGAREVERLGVRPAKLPVGDLPRPGAVDRERLCVGASGRDRVREDRILRAPVVTHAPLVRRDPGTRAGSGRHRLCGVHRAGALDVPVVAEVLRGRLQDVLRRPVEALRDCAHVRPVRLVDQRRGAGRDGSRAARAAPGVPGVLAVQHGVERHVAGRVRAVGDHVDARARRSRRSRGSTRPSRRRPSPG